MPSLSKLPTLILATFNCSVLFVGCANTLVNKLSEYTPPSATAEFYWSNRGSSWGPIYNQDTLLYNDLNADYKNKFSLNEGYWYDRFVAEPSLINLPFNTYTTCAKARSLGVDGVSKLLTKPNQSANGFWHRNYGFYNNLRIISADNALSQVYNETNNFVTCKHIKINGTHVDKL